MEQLALIVLCVAFAFYALERIPFPASPPWLRRAAEFALALVVLLVLLPRVGINIGH